MAGLQLRVRLEERRHVGYLNRPIALNESRSAGLSRVDDRKMRILLVTEIPKPDIAVLLPLTGVQNHPQIQEPGSNRRNQCGVCNANQGEVSC
jgi:hypothetical protein